jgi:hypothetical protein
MAKVVEAVVHVGASIDIEVLTLAVSDGESIGLGSVSVFAEEGRHKGAVGLSIHILEDLVVEEADSEEGKSFPSPGELSEVTNTRNSLKAQPEASSPAEDTVAGESLIEVIKALSVLNRDVVGEKVDILAVEGVYIEPFKTIILNHVFLEPRSTGDLGHTREVSEGGNLI